MATQVELEVAGEHDLFAPANNDVPEAIKAPKGGQEPVTIMPDIEGVVPGSTTVSSSERTSKISSQMRESITWLDFSINFGS